MILKKNFLFFFKWLVFQTFDLGSAVHLSWTETWSSLMASLFILIYVFPMLNWLCTTVTVISLLFFSGLFAVWACCLWPTRKPLPQKASAGDLHIRDICPLTSVDKVLFSQCSVCSCESLDVTFSFHVDACALAFQETVSQLIKGKNYR